MTTVFLGLLFITLGLVALALQRLYSSVPAKELKRLAARGDHLAEALYRPVAYGVSMRLLLWTFFIFGLTGGFVLLVSTLVTWAAFIVIFLTVTVGVLLQSLRLTVRRAHFAVQIAPALSWLLMRTHRPFDAISDMTSRFREHAAHSGLFEKEDLLDLLNQQTKQPDNRIADHDLRILSNALRFDDRHAAEVMLPMSQARLVNKSDHIGPILLGELHESRQQSFMVYEDTPDHIVGTLQLSDAVQAREGGLVSELMRKQVAYVHEDFSLHRALAAFTLTGQPVVVVINAFEEPVGVLSLTQLLTQLLGETSEEGFDAFEDRAAVAAFVPELPEPVEPTGEDASPEPTEVVE